MFQFPRFLSLELCIHSRIARCYSNCVPTFGYPRIVAYLLLPEAFRSLSRPSSASIAKASSMRPFLFNHHFSFDEFEILIIYSFIDLLFFLLHYLVFKEQYFFLRNHSFIFLNDLSKPSNKNSFFSAFL